MRINKFVAQATGLSRRAADTAIAEGRVEVNGQKPAPGTEVTTDDTVTLDKRPITPAVKTLTLILNKPVGYVVSRAGQGSQTIYDLLPAEYQSLKPVGRLDKDSSGLLLLTNDGQLANRLTHPRYAKQKVYEIELNKPLSPTDQAKIEQGIELEDGLSHIRIKPLDKNNLRFTVTMIEGRNRQIRRTFAALGYQVVHLHRTDFGDFHLGNLCPGQFLNVA